MIDWIQKYWQLLFVGTISYIGGLAAPTLVKIIDEALTKIFRIISEKSFKEIISSLKKFNGWVNLKLKIIKYNLLSNHSFTEDEYNIYKKLSVHIFSQNFAPSASSTQIPNISLYPCMLYPKHI